MGNMLELMNIQMNMMAERARQEIRVCNEVSCKFGLTLSEEAVGRLVESRANALKDTGRIEFEGGILPKLIYALCDSPYINQDNYEKTLAELQQLFYSYKTEVETKYTDDEVIECIVKVFNGRANGSVDYIIGVDFEELKRRMLEDRDMYGTWKAGDDS